jgi:uncharacterized protein YjiS (DUF1127 family)
MRPYYFDFEQQNARRARAIAMARPVAWHRLPSPPPAESGGVLRSIIDLIRLWRRRVRERRELAQLDYRTLRDVGITPAEVEHECNKPFWRA